MTCMTLADELNKRKSRGDINSARFVTLHRPVHKQHACAYCVITTKRSARIPVVGLDRGVVVDCTLWLVKVPVDHVVD